MFFLRFKSSWELSKVKVCGMRKHARQPFPFVGQLQLFYVVREVQRDLNRLLKRVFRVIHIHVCFQLKAISNNLLAALGKRTIAPLPLLDSAQGKPLLDLRMQTFLFPLFRKRTPTISIGRRKYTCSHLHLMLTKKIVAPQLALELTYNQPWMDINPLRKQKNFLF